MPVEMLKHEETSFLDRFGRFAGIRIAHTTVAKDTRLVNASTRSLRAIRWCRTTNAAAALALGALRAAGFSGAAERCRRHVMHAKSRRLLPWLNRRPGEVRIDLPAPVRAALPERFAGSNRRLSELTGIDFSAYGYVSQ